MKIRRRFQEVAVAKVVVENSQQAELERLEQGIFIVSEQHLKSGTHAQQPNGGG